MKEAKPFNITQVLLPVVIGFIVIGWLFVHEFGTESFAGIRFNLYSAGFILLAFLLVWTTLLYIGLFRRPDLIVGFFSLIFRLPWLNRWQSKIQIFSESLINASNDFKKKSWLFWPATDALDCHGG